MAGETGKSSHYLLAKEFGFSIPEAADIVQVLGQVRRKASAANAVKDNSVRLFVGGVVVGFDLKQQSPVGHPAPYWATTAETINYGGSPTTVWGLPSLAPADANGKGFGFAISATSVASEAVFAEVDLISMGIYYTEASDPNRVCFATRSLEFRTDDVIRQHSTEDVWGRVVPEGFLSYAPPSGLEKRTIRGVISPSQGDLGELADSGSSRLSCVVKYRPAYLFAREAA